LSDRATWRRWPWLLIAALGLVLWVQWPSLDGGFFDDDFAQLAAARHLDEPSLAARSRLDLYRFFSGNPDDGAMLIRRGAVPWWFEPSTQMAFMRPLSSALMVVDVVLLGSNATLAHVHSLLWACAFVFAVWLVARQLEPRAAGVASLLFAASPYSVGLSVVWWCNRHLIVSGTFGCLALWAHLRWRNENWRHGRWLGPLGLLLALAGGESGMQSVALIAAFELIGTKTALSGRLKALATIALSIVGYSIVRRMLGYGTRGEMLYCDPIAEPSRFMGEVVARVPKLVLGMWGGGVQDALPWPWGLAELVFVSMLVVLVASAIMRRSVTWNALAWVALGVVASSVLAVSSPAIVLSTPSVAVALGSSLLVVSAFDRVREAARLPQRVVVGTFGLALVGCQLLYPPLQVRRGMETKAREQRDLGGTLLNADVDPNARDVVVLAGWQIGWDALAAMNMFRPDLHLHAWWNLTDSPFDRTTYTRSGPRSLQIACIDPGCSLVVSPSWYRGPEFPWNVGYEVAFDGASVRVLEASATGPSRIEISFDHDLESTCFLIYDNRVYRRVPLPR
jgi:hypothetical protein